MNNYLDRQYFITSQLKRIDYKACNCGRVLVPAALQLRIDRIGSLLYPTLVYTGATVADEVITFTLDDQILLLAFGYYKGIISQGADIIGSVELIRRPLAASAGGGVVGITCGDPR